ncbi:hypothetical protein JGS22_012310 [Streptomyces sp. P38-E01]|uniref:Uncharacterized protein n=1 Tax=Streptomyces tardus TaxID=2780544 RepID=A0A949JG92_9ACTN|nr:hypothetical protein [Streptomyces tardus]MBU7598378.1 hypothetical protein [Streptomyces tardus]
MSAAEEMERARQAAARSLSASREAVAALRDLTRCPDDRCSRLCCRGRVPASPYGDRRAEAYGLRRFRSEVLACLPGDQRLVPLGSRCAATPRLAVHWLRHRAERIADQLDPPEAELALRWLKDQREHEHSLSALVRGVGYTFTLCTEAARYLLMATPVHLPEEQP